MCESERRIVYRVEGLFDARGPFTSGDTTNAYYDGMLQAIHDGSEVYDERAVFLMRAARRLAGMHPLKVRGATVNHRWGCATLDHLRTWFPSPNGRASLAECGVVISVYSVPASDLIVGPSEAAFDHTTAEHLGCFPITCL